MLKTKLTSDQVKHVAQLANLPLSDDQIVDYQDKLSKTLEFVGELATINTNAVKPTTQVTGKTNAFREDLILPSLSQDDALKNASATHNGFFIAKIKWS